MKTRFRMFQRANGTFYYEDVESRQQLSLRTKERKQAERLLHAKNEAAQQPALNLQMARAYLIASDPLVASRTWQFVMDEIIKTHTGSTLIRWQRAAKDRAFDLIRQRPVLETRSEEFLKVLQTGTVATNVYLRRIHNYALDMSWLPWPVIPRKKWLKVQYREKRAITFEEHQRIIAREPNPERRAFYRLAWHVGASQSDLANLHTDNIDWANHVISFERMKIRGRGQQPVQIRFGAEVAAILVELPRLGPLFPYLRTVRSGDRATEFKQRCNGLGIHGVSLHSYRYAWAERGQKAGYPERYAQQALGHNSKAVHRAYAKRAQVLIPTLEQYEDKLAEGKIIPGNFQNGIAVEGEAVEAKG